MDQKLLPIFFVDRHGIKHDDPLLGMPCIDVEFSNQKASIAYENEIGKTEKCIALIDTGATDIVVSSALLLMFDCDLAEITREFRINNEARPRKIYWCNLLFRSASFNLRAQVVEDIDIMPIKGYNIILGLSFIRRCELRISRIIGQSSLNLVDIN